MYYDGAPLDALSDLPLVVPAIGPQSSESHAELSAAVSELMLRKMHLSTRKSLKDE